MQFPGLPAKRAFALCLLAGARLAAQKAQPDFENDQAIVNAPHPGIDVPGFARKMHDHPLNRVMVYLHPGGELLHYRDGSTKVLKWQAGEVQWSPASGLHFSEIPSANPVFSGPMIVDIGIKKAGDPGKVASAALDPLRVDPKDCTLELENSQVRVIRVKLGPRRSVPLHEHVLNYLMVYITDGNVRETSSEGKAEVSPHKAGEFRWSGPSRQRVDNLNDKPFEAVVVEFRN